MSEKLEFYPGYCYETRDRSIVICLIHNAPNAYRPIALMNIKSGKVFSVNNNGSYYSSMEDSDDIIRMLPNEPDYDLIARARTVKENIAIIKQLKQIENDAISGASVRNYGAKILLHIKEHIGLYAPISFFFTLLFVATTTYYFGVYIPMHTHP